jgi:hypothetical protein
MSPSVRQSKGIPRPGGPDLNATFKELRELLRAYQPPLIATVHSPNRYELWSEKEVVVAGRKRARIFFASAIIQKSYVGLYFLPVYVAPEMKQAIAPELRALLKGKSCFHIKSLDARARSQVRSALAKGFRLYRERGWV